MTQYYSICLVHFSTMSHFTHFFSQTNDQALEKLSNLSDTHLPRILNLKIMRYCNSSVGRQQLILNYSSIHLSSTTKSKYKVVEGVGAY